MDNNKFLINLFNKASREPIGVTVMLGFVNTLLSFLTVYFISLIFVGEVHPVYITLSIVMPIAMTPLAVIAFLRIFDKLLVYKQKLHEEIEKSREKDLLLFEQERFALMGEMLSNISHQWRQPLNTINLTILSTKVANASGRIDTEQIEKSFDLIEQNTHYLSNTIEDFRSFFQNNVPTKLLQATDIIREINSIMKPGLEAKDIALHVTWESDLIHRVNIAASLSQVLLNLLGNAKDAVLESGNDDKEIRIDFNNTPDSIVVTVIDNGIGITPDIKTKMFDPYFTTKGSLKGSGIGLHMSRQIVEKVFDGNLFLDESVIDRTCFRLELPYSDYCREV